MTNAPPVISSAIRDFIVETFLFGDDSELENDTSFMDSSLIDSMGILQVTGFIEKNFGIKIADKDFTPVNLDSIERISQFIQGKQPTA